ncbi:hypothetical protein IP86_10265 [Rhodopseudomonas sp. AAP120]|uniref:hypothetical protein n=1 Tax=Rhodopseudomonas sp. AAP120 TaxID=1523430 RepID=UPI0006B96D73|nr:hypothetical protein [Rhodopseudomonas sp. AAP120]KPF98960.1 hypothetical protein IP86_10265 [Rhodopseudomonas sp. AAP120]
MLLAKYCWFAAVAAVLMTAPAAAQTAPGGADGQGAPVRVQTSISFFVAGSGTEDELPQKLDQARKTVYLLATRECELLRSTIAKDCRLESVNSNVRQAEGRSPQLQQPSGYSVSGTIGSVITLKALP